MKCKYCEEFELLDSEETKADMQQAGYQCQYCEDVFIPVHKEDTDNADNTE